MSLVQLIIIKCLPSARNYYGSKQNEVSALKDLNILLGETENK